MAPRCALPSLPPRGGHRLLAAHHPSPSPPIGDRTGLFDFAAGGERPGGASASPPVGGGGGGGGGDTRGSPRRLSPVASLDAEERTQADACSSQCYQMNPCVTAASFYNTLAPDAAGKFDSSHLVALLHANVLFALDKFDESERECRPSLRIQTPSDPDLDAVPPPAVSVPGADYESRVSSVKKQLRILLKRVIVVAALCWSSIKSTRAISASRVYTDAVRFLKNQSSWCSFTCPSSGITLRQDSDQHAIFHTPRVQPMFESLLLSPSIGIQAEPFAQVRQRKRREGAEIVEDIEKRPRMLPKDTPSTEFEESSLAIHDLWLKFLETSALDHREVILPAGETLYTALFHKLDAGSPQTTKIMSFAELPILFDEEFCKDICKNCGSQLSIDLLLSNTPHFFTIVLNWLGGSESQGTLSDVLAGITYPIDTGFFGKSADSSTMYTVTSMPSCSDDTLKDGEKCEESHCAAIIF